MSRRHLSVITAIGPAPVPPSPMERALLPWEEPSDFLDLHRRFHREHVPDGATETTLVDRLVWIEWRRARLLLGERAVHMAALQDRLGADHKAAETVRRALIDSDDKAKKEELADALTSPPDTDHPTLADANEDAAMTQTAVAILETGDPAAYEEALAVVRPDTAAWWEDVVGDDEQTHPDGLQQEGDSYLPYSRNSVQLLRFLKDEVVPIFKKTRGEISRRPAIRLQAHGESLDPFRMDRILSLDERLTRQFEKTLGMLLRLQELRGRSAAAVS